MRKFLSIIVPITIFVLSLHIIFAYSSIEIPDVNETTYKVQIRTNYDNTWNDALITDPPRVDKNGNFSVRGYTFYRNATGHRTSAHATNGTIIIGPTQSTAIYCGDLDASGYNFDCTVDTEDVIPSTCNRGENCTVYIWVNDTSGLEGNRTIKLWVSDLNITDEHDNSFILTFSKDKIIVNQTVKISGYVYYRNEYNANNISNPVNRTTNIYIKDPCEQKTYGSGGWSSSRGSTDKTGKFSISYKPNCTGNNLQLYLKAKDPDGIEHTMSSKIAVYTKSVANVTLNRDITMTEIETIPKLLKNTPDSAVFSVSKIQEIEITSKKRVTSGKITIEEVDSITGVTKPVSKTYQMFNITKENIPDSYITKVRMKFKVDKAWINANNVDPDTIKMVKRSGSNWNNLTTTMLKSDNTYYYYNTTSTSFSVYAIIGDQYGSVNASDYLNISSYPSEISIEQGKTQTKSVTVNNINSTVNQSVKLLVNGLDSNLYSVSPGSSSINMDANKTFNLTFTIPLNQSIKDYEAKFNASSSYDYTTKSFILTVTPGKQMIKTINSTLNDYINQFNELEKEYNKTKAANKTSLDTAYTVLKSDINSAISFRKKSDYKSVYDLLGDIETGLTRTREELDKIGGFNFMSIFSRVIILVAVGVGVLFVVYMFWPVPLEGQDQVKKGESLKEEKDRIKDKFDEEHKALEEKLEIKDDFDREYRDLKKIQKQTEQESNKG